MKNNLISKFKLFFFSGNNLIKNAYYLINTGLVATIAGYLFWIVATRYYSVEIIAQLGVLMSFGGFLVTLGDMGIGIASIRFLPAMNSIDAKKFIYKALFINFTFVSLWYLLSIEFFRYLAKYDFLFTGQVLFIFYLFTTMSGLLYAWGSFFTGLRKNNFGFYQELIVNIGKFCLLIIIAQFADSLESLILGGAIAMLVANIYGLYKLINITDKESKNSGTGLLFFEKRLIKYAARNWLGRFTLDAHQYLVPILVYVVLKPFDAGIFYVCWICGLMFRVIPNACLNSLFAKLSENNPKKRLLVQNALTLNFTILLIALIFLFTLGGYILNLFGPIYSEHINIVILIAFASIPWSLNYLIVIFCRVNDQILLINVIGVTLLVTILLLVPYLGAIYGMYGVAIAYIVAQLLSVVTGLLAFKLFIPSEKFSLK